MHVFSNYIILPEDLKSSKTGCRTVVTRQYYKVVYWIGYYHPNKASCQAVTVIT